jgi:hypothetical protein
MASNEENAMLRSLAAATLLSLAALMPGCIAIGGSPTVQKPTVGQELTDLKTALDRGAITQAEYDSKKAQLLGARN